MFRVIPRYSSIAEENKRTDMYNMAMNVFHRMRLNVFVVSISALALAPFVIFAWSGPPSGAACTDPPCPPGNNVAAPINVGAIDQVKNGGLGVSSLAVFGNSLFGGSYGSNAYLNFGATVGEQGYGIRDNAGLLEFKNSGGAWESIQSIVFNLVGGSGGSSGSITGTLLYPDGPNGTPITSSALSYSVPAGKSLYITNIRTSSYCFDMNDHPDLYIVGKPVVTLPRYNGGIPSFEYPLIAGAGSVVSLSQAALDDYARYPTLNCQLLFNGFLVDTGVTPITSSALSYSVPAGKSLYITNIRTSSYCFDMNDHPDLYIGGKPVVTLPRYNGCIPSFEYPLIAGAGSVVSLSQAALDDYARYPTLNCQLLFNGYLADAN